VALPAGPHQRLQSPPHRKPVIPVYGMTPPAPAPAASAPDTDTPAPDTRITGVRDEITTRVWDAMIRQAVAAHGRAPDVVGDALAAALDGGGRGRERGRLGPLRRPSGMR
jgi:hypothetical protein